MEEDADDDTFHGSPNGESPAKRLASKPSQSTTQSKCGTSFDYKWKAVMTNETTLPDFTKDEILRGFGVLMARLSHLEEAQRRDRGRILYLETERQTHLSMISDMDKRVQASLQGCAQLPGAPAYESVIDTCDVDPRAMTIHELKCVDDRLRKLRPDGKQAEECSKIMGSAVDAHGVVTWDVTSLPARKQWQLFYYLFFRKVQINASLTERAAAQVQSVHLACPLKRVEISSEPHKQAADAEEDSSDFEYGYGDDMDSELGEGEGEGGEGGEGESDSQL